MNAMTSRVRRVMLGQRPPARRGSAGAGRYRGHGPRFPAELNPFFMPASGPGRRGQYSQPGHVAAEEFAELAARVLAGGEMKG
jgi:hypothetical protein